VDPVSEIGVDDVDLRGVLGPGWPADDEERKGKE